MTLSRLLVLALALFLSSGPFACATDHEHGSDASITRPEPADAGETRCLLDDNAPGPDDAPEPPIIDLPVPCTEH